MTAVAKVKRIVREDGMLVCEERRKLPCLHIVLYKVFRTDMTAMPAG